MNRIDAIRLQTELELFRSVFLLMVEGMSMENSLSIVCWSNHGIMEFMDIYPLDIVKHFFLISIVAKEIKIMEN
jgi:hypothetical protein